MQKNYIKISTITGIEFSYEECLSLPLMGDDRLVYSSHACILPY